MRIIITGGGGFLGSRLARRLLHQARDLQLHLLRRAVAGIELDPEHAVEVVGLVLPLLYFSLVALKTHQHWRSVANKIEARFDPLKDEMQAIEFGDPPGGGPPQIVAAAPLSVDPGAAVVLTLGLAGLANAAAITCGGCHSVPPANADNCNNDARRLHGTHVNYSSTTYKVSTREAKSRIRPSGSGLTRPSLRVDAFGSTSRTY